MMEAVRIPPFETLYLAHRDEVFGFLVRRVGRERAEDAFQETFLRALRGYPALRHGEHLRAWLYTIAARVAVDEHRRRSRLSGEAGPVEGVWGNRQVPPADDRRPEYAELEHLADGLPAKERAAVVLRYGYDLSYADIGMALGSSEDAARQAASSGVRRLRQRRIEIS
jgi:RNA polymerase sigma factor (sigma-70 family)